MIKRLPIALLFGALLVLGHGASAAGTVAFSDKASDANGINGQEEGGGNGVATGPASVGAVDLRRVVVAPVYRPGTQSMVAIRVAMTLTDRPARGYAYHLSARSPGCRQLVLDHYRFRSGATRTRLRPGCSGGAVMPRTLPDATVDGTTLTMRIPVSALPAAVRQDGVLTGLYAYTRGNLGDAPGLRHPVTPVQYDSTGTAEQFRLGR